MDMNTAEQLLARIQSQNVSRPGQETRAGRIMSKNYRQWCWEHQALKWWPRMIIYNVPIVRWTIVNVMRMNSSFPISSFKTSVVPSHGFLAFSLSRLKRSRSLGFRLLQTLGYRFWWELAWAGTLAFFAPWLQVGRDLNYELIHSFELWVAPWNFDTLCMWTRAHQ